MIYRHEGKQKALQRKQHKVMQCRCEGQAPCQYKTKRIKRNDAQAKRNENRTTKKDEESQANMADKITNKAISKVEELIESKLGGAQSSLLVCMP